MLNYLLRSFKSIRANGETLSFLLVLTVSVCSFINLAVATYAEEVDINVTMSLSSPQIHVGESTLLTISAVNFEPDNEPSFENLADDFLVERQAPSTQTFSRSFFDGTQQRTEKQRIVRYNFLLTPKKSGSFIIQAPELLHNGKQQEAQPVQLDVLEPTRTNLVLLESSVSATSIFPLIPFEISIDVFIKDPPPKYGSYDLLRSINEQLGAPQLSIPWLQSRTINSNAIAEVELEDWLNQIYNSESGFTINNFELTKNLLDFDFSFFGRNKTSTFLPKPEKVERIDPQNGKVSYTKYSFKRKFRPQVPGKLEFTPSVLKGEFIDFTNEKEPRSKEVYLTTDPITVTVKEIPEKDVPNNYTGIYGVVKQSVDVSSQKVTVGEVFSLTISLRGYGAFEGAKAPDISFLEQDGSFKIYPATELSLEDGVAFEYKIRPLKDGKQLLPSVKTSYFNVESGTFVEESSNPIELEVSKSLLKGDGEAKHIDNETTDSNTTRSDILKSKSRESHLITRLTALGVALCLLLFALTRGARRLVKYRNQRMFLSNKRILDSSRSLLKSGLNLTTSNPLEGLLIIRLAFIQLIGKRFKESPEALTDAELADFFESECNDDKSGTRFFNLNKLDENKKTKALNTLKRVQQFFQKVEQIRFGGANVDLDSFTKETETLFNDWTSILTEQFVKLSKIASPLRR